MPVLFTIELEVETDGRWVAEVLELPGTLAYGATQEEAIARAGIGLARGRRPARAC